MTFNVTVPNAAQSPGIFPAQNNTNFQRIKDIVNADHNFVDTAATNQGAHKQVSLINRADPVALTGGTNGVLYSKDVNGVPQFFFYNGVTVQQITPIAANFVEEFVASNVVAGNSSVLILTLSTNAYGTVFVIYAGVNKYRRYWFYKNGSVLEVFQTDQSPNTDRPQITTNGSTTLHAFNAESGSNTLRTYIQISRFE